MTYVSFLLHIIVYIEGISHEKHEIIKKKSYLASSYDCVTKKKVYSFKFLVYKLYFQIQTCLAIG